MGWEDSVDSIDQSTLEQNALLYPWVQWVNGQVILEQIGNVAYTGGWFCPKDAVASPLAGWTPITLLHRNGAKTEGYAMRDIEIAVLRLRHRWLATVQGQVQRFPWKKYDQACAAADKKSATGHTQVAVVIRGLEQHGIFVLTMKGSAGKAWTGIIIEFAKRVVHAADAIVAAKGKKNKFACRAFWLKIGPKRKADGKPDFEMVGKDKDTSQVTLPTLLGVSEKPDEAEIAKLFVGEALLKELNTLWVEASTWAEEPTWDGTQAAPETNGYNGVAPIEEDEAVPF